MKKIVITGANGMIGTALVKGLLDGDMSASKYELILVDQHINRLSSFAERATIVRSDLSSMHEWQQTLDGVFCVIHLAAAVHWRPRTKEDKQLFVQTNVEGTRMLYDACLQHRVRRLLFFSTNDVYESSDSVITEETAPRPDGLYGITKLLAERFLMEASHDGCTAVCVFRPSSVYGENDRGSMRSLVEFCRKGVAPMIGKGTNTKALLYLKDVVQAVMRYLENEDDLNGQVFNISSGNYQYREIVDAICNSYALTPLRLRIPTWFCRTVASRVAALERLAVAGEEKIVSCEKARRILGYQGVYSLINGLTDAREYYMKSS